MKLRSWPLIVTWLIASGSAYAQSSITDNLCRSYSDKPVFRVGETGLGFTCAELQRLAVEFPMTEDPFGDASERVRRLKGLKLGPLPSDSAPSNCEQLASQSAVRCRMTSSGVEGELRMLLNRAGYVHEVQMEIFDARPLLSPGLSLILKQRQYDEILPLANALLIDIGLLKLNSFRQPGEVVRRIGYGLEATFKTGEVSE